MAALSVTAANCISTTQSAVGKGFGQVGEAVTAGAVIYQKSTDSKFYLAQNDGTAEESGSGVVLGIALGAAATNQFVAYQTSGTITSGATHTKGYQVYLHSTAGSFTETIADVTSTKYVTLIGIATTTAIVNLAFNATGLTVT